MVTYKKGVELGQGTFGIVNKAVDEKGAIYALKTFRDPSIPGVARDDLVRRFEREVRLQSSINHPNVIRIIGANSKDDPPWFVMELAQGSLKDLVDQGNLDPGLKRHALFDILAGLEAIHDLGYKHRDLKPGNVLYIPRNGNACFAISDFGLGAPREGETSTLTGTGVQGGTEMYAAPELAKSFRRATCASDIYSFGAILHDLFVGKRRTPYAKQYGPGAIGQIIEKCTETLPLRRYRTIAALRSDLYTAFEEMANEPVSNEDQRIIDILGQEHQTSEEWDIVFLRIDDIEDAGAFSRKVIASFSDEKIASLAAHHPDLLNAFALHLLGYVLDNEGGFNFDYCDVLADQIVATFSHADIEGQAFLLLALLILGPSHNRWYVERRFASLANANANAAVIDRLIVEATARSKDIISYLNDLVMSIRLPPAELHENLRSLIAQ